ncbi:MAG: hypothetical protein MPJ24_05385 [Pirellulaceae bacterium]|nr:hypothetical protein [Pirellulaceae bacterium]
MPLYEIETAGHIVITWAETEEIAREKLVEAFPEEEVVRLTKRPRDSWVISKSIMGLTETSKPCEVARDCLMEAHGDKLGAIRLYMKKTGADMEKSRRAIESNMVMGW